MEGKRARIDDGRRAVFAELVKMKFFDPLLEVGASGINAPPPPFSVLLEGKECEK